VYNSPSDQLSNLVGVQLHSQQRDFGSSEGLQEALARGSVGRATGLTFIQARQSGLLFGQSAPNPRFNQGHCLFTRHNPVHPAIKRLGCLTRHWQGHYVIVVVKSKVRPRCQRGHLFVPCVQQARPPQDASHPVDQGHIQRIVCATTGYHVTGNQVSRWFSRSRHQLQLRQVGSEDISAAGLAIGTWVGSAVTTTYSTTVSPSFSTILVTSTSTLSGVGAAQPASRTVANVNTINGDGFLYTFCKRSAG
jgi:hypothetical protein